MMGWSAFHAIQVCRFCVCLLILSTVLLPAIAAEPDEGGLWQLWQQHAAPPHDHEALLAACQAFTEAHATDSLIAVSRTLAGWHLLQLGRDDEAATVLQRCSSTGANALRDNSLRDGATAIALAWLSRMDREKVKKALQFYYRRNVAYPRKLTDLAAYPMLPKSLSFDERDRWHLYWSYRLTGLKTIPGLLDQKYELQSQRLGDGSDLAEALTVPCGALLRVEPVRVRSTTPGREVLELRYLPAGETREAENTAGGIVISTVGSWTDSVYLAYVGRYVVIVNDYHHWKVLPKPGVR